VEDETKTQEPENAELEEEAEGAEELPDREMLSVVNTPGESLGPPPVAE
jgi:hypothetical protein